MDDTEGSVFVDGIDGEDSSEESTNESVNNQSEENSEGEESTSTEESTDAESGNTEEVAEEEAQDTDKTDVTEKGTKLDPDPLSQANQLRANAERQTRQYEALLNDPDRLKAYVKELEAESGAKQDDIESPALDSLDPTKLETVEDLQNFAKALKEATQKEISQVQKQLSGFTSTQVEEKTISRIQGEISSIKDTYPELREFNADGSKNPDYNEELDTLVGETYNELDLDPKTGKYRGSISVKQIADRIMKARSVGEGSGSRKAKTTIVDKRGGRVITSQTGGEGKTIDESKLSASATIAQRLQRASKKK